MSLPFCKSVPREWSASYEAQRIYESCCFACFIFACFSLKYRLSVVRDDFEVNKSFIDFPSKKKTRRRIYHARYIIKILDINICAFNNWNDDWFIGAINSSFFSYLIFMCNTDKKKLAILAVANNNDWELTNIKTYNYLIIIIYIDFLFCLSFFDAVYFFCFLDSISLDMTIRYDMISQCM